MEYIATFFSHFGAVDFKKKCDRHQISSRLMPVPRTLSSSCGICVKYTAEHYLPTFGLTEEIEQIAEVQSDSFSIIYRAKDI